MNNLDSNEDDDEFECSECDFKCSSKIDIVEHSEIHQPPNNNIENVSNISPDKSNIKSDFCNNIITTSKPNVKRDRRGIYVGKERTYLCNQCPAAFYVKSKLNAHIRIHTGEKPYKCDECGKAFVQSSNLKAHQKIHTDVRPYPCDECGKSFRANSYLTVHKRLHSGEKPYVCAFCNEGFYSSTHLANHIRVHTGEKPYICDYDNCAEAFAQALELRIHKCIHTGEAPYKCWECDAAFISDKDRTVHRNK
ncbi:unnamed protein product, partial [Meganyctiphanes norvegica]